LWRETARETAQSLTALVRRQATALQASKQAGPPGRGAGKRRACQWDPNPKRVGLTIVSNKNLELS